jgi:hypothetical protein
MKPSRRGLITRSASAGRLHVIAYRATLDVPRELARSSNHRPQTGRSRSSTTRPKRVIEGSAVGPGRPPGAVDADHQSTTQCRAHQRRGCDPPLRHPPPHRRHRRAIDVRDRQLPHGLEAPVAVTAGLGRAGRELTVRSPHRTSSPPLRWGAHRTGPPAASVAVGR